MSLDSMDMDMRTDGSWGSEYPLKGLTNYERSIKGVTVDVYDVLKGFNISCPAMQHAIKKMLFAGLRGAKDFDRDADEAILSIKRSKELNKWK